MIFKERLNRFFVRCIVFFDILNGVISIFEEIRFYCVNFTEYKRNEKKKKIKIWLIISFNYVRRMLYNFTKVIT